MDSRVTDADKAFTAWLLEHGAAFPKLQWPVQPPIPSFVCTKLDLVVRMLRGECRILEGQSGRFTARWRRPIVRIRVCG